MMETAGLPAFTFNLYREVCYERFIPSKYLFLLYRQVSIVAFSVLHAAPRNYLSQNKENKIRLVSLFVFLFTLSLRNNALFRAIININNEDAKKVMLQEHIGEKRTHLPTRLLLTLTALVTLFFCTEVSANASAKDVHEMADICMQANRILKDYALVGMEVKYHDPAKDLKENLELIEKEIKDLEGHKHNEKITAEIVEIEKSWHTIKPEFEKKPDKSKMHDLRVMVEKFTDRCEEIAEDIAKDTGIKGEHDVVLVAALGMESQRLAALYLMKAWGVADPNYDEEVKEVVEQTEKIYKELLEADEKLVSKEIKEKLKKVEKDFIAFSVMATSKSGRFMPAAAEKMASKIFKELRTILDMEQKLVEGKVSGYFLPIADEKSAGEIFRATTGIVYVKGEIGS